MASGHSRDREYPTKSGDFAGALVDPTFTAPSISAPRGLTPGPPDYRRPLESQTNVAASREPRYVDISNPSLAVDCPRCGLKTPRFLDLCRNDGYKLWPSSYAASAAFKAWRSADPARAAASRYDMEIPQHVEYVIDYDAKAHALGIHMPPPSRWPFVICAGALFLSLAAIPFANEVRITLAVIGGLIFLIGVVGWVLVEDVQMYPAESAEGGEAHH
jgi:hypothetical protein